MGHIGSIDPNAGAGAKAAGAQLSRASDKVEAQMDRVAAAQARVVAREDTLAVIEAEDEYIRWSQDNMDNHTQRNLTVPGELAGVDQESQSAQTDILSKWSGSDAGLQDARAALRQKGTARRGDIVGAHNTQKAAKLDRRIDENTNGMATAIKNDPHNWSRYMDVGVQSLQTKEDSVGPTKYQNKLMGRQKTAMRTAISKFAENGDTIGMVSVLSHSLYATRFSGVEQTAIRAEIRGAEARNNEDLSFVQIVRRTYKEAGVTNTAEVDAAVLEAVNKKYRKAPGADRPQTKLGIVADYLGTDAAKRAPDSVNDAVVTAIMSGGKIDIPSYDHYDNPGFKAFAASLGGDVSLADKKTKWNAQDDAGRVAWSNKGLATEDATAMENWLDTIYDGKSTPERIALWESKPDHEKRVYNKLSGVIQRPPIDLVIEKFEAAFGEGLTEKGRENAAVYVGVDYKSNTIYDRTKLYQEIEQADPPQAMVAKWKSQGLPAGSPINALSGNSASIGQAWLIKYAEVVNQNGYIPTRNDRLEARVAAANMVAGQPSVDNSGNKTTHFPKLSPAMKDILDSTNTPYPEMPQQFVDIPRSKTWDWDVNPVAQANGFFNLVNKFHGLGAVYDRAVSKLPFETGMTQGQQQAVAVVTQANFLMNLTIEASKPSGRLLAAQYKQIKALLEPMFTPQIFQQKEAGMIMLRQLDIQLAQRAKAAERIEQMSAANFPEARAEAKALANGIWELRHALAVPPSVRTQEEKAALAPGMVFYAKNPDKGNKWSLYRIKALELDLGKN
tara:strand:+ start:11558 stop:13912 length:2355 start_codon:yes stop_codon:yes gene_type:complete